MLADGQAGRGFAGEQRGRKVRLTTSTPAVSADAAHVIAAIVSRRAGRLAGRTFIRGCTALESESAKNNPSSDVLHDRPSTTRPALKLC